MDPEPGNRRLPSAFFFALFKHSWLAGWLAGWLGWLAGWLAGWLITIPYVVRPLNSAEIPS